MQLNTIIFITVTQCILLTSGIIINNQYYDPEQFSLIEYSGPINSVTVTANTTSSYTDIEFFSTTYGGLLGNKYNIYGYKPVSDGSYPLYIHLAGTTGDYWDNVCKHYTEYMASSAIHFVAVSIEYPDRDLYPLGCRTIVPHSFNDKASALWDTSKTSSAIAVLCALSFVDCGKAIVVSGFSQGSNLASQAAKYGLNESVTALYLISAGDTIFINGETTPFLHYPCLSFDSLNINQNKIRSIVNENDEFFGVNLEGVREQQKSITNHTECDAENCIDENDGSGFYIVSKLEDPLAGTGHCYAFAQPTGEVLDCFFVLGVSEIYMRTDELWGFESNMNWLINMAQNNMAQNNMAQNNMAQNKMAPETEGLRWSVIRIVLVVSVSINIIFTSVILFFFFKYNT